MTQGEPLSWVIDVAGLPGEGLDLAFRADPAALARIAAHAGIPAVKELRAEGHIRPIGAGIEVRLRLQADVIQSCVVTLEPVPGRIDEPVLRRYIRDLESPHVAVEIVPHEEEPDEPLEGDTIDLGPVLAEELVLALDPYPRAPGAKLTEADRQAGEETSPFAVLERLKEPR